MCSQRWLTGRTRSDQRGPLESFMAIWPTRALQQPPDPDLLTSDTLDVFVEKKKKKLHPGELQAHTLNKSLRIWSQYWEQRGQAGRPSITVTSPLRAMHHGILSSKSYCSGDTDFFLFPLRAWGAGLLTFDSAPHISNWYHRLPFASLKIRATHIYTEKKKSKQKWWKTENAREWGKKMENTKNMQKDVRKSEDGYEELWKLKGTGFPFSDKSRVNI